MNTLDAVDRRARAASEQLARTVVTVPPPEPAQLEQAARRDDRFDPEDWAGAEHEQHSSAPRPAPPARTRRDDDEDEDNYPDTWLR